jgi:FMN phosphatase YigB (HAD superfamily)
MTRVLLFDLDETLMVEEPAAPAAFSATAQLAAHSYHGIAKDVDGALAAGLGAVWVNRTGRPVPADRLNLVEISTLDDLPDTLAELAHT